MEEIYKKLINKNKYQVFLFSCPDNIPLSFARHSWFVLNKKSKISRWEVLFRKKDVKNRWGHLYKNFFPPFLGLEIFPYVEKYFWKPTFLGYIEGDKDSFAYKVINFIEKSKDKYPYNYNYFLMGPNCNTYTQWVLDNFPQFKAKLPWNAIGKNYKI